MPKYNFMANFSCKIHLEGSLLCVNLKGTASAVDMLNSYYEAIEQAKKEGAQRILLDMRELVMDYQSFDMFNVLNILAKKLASFKIARLINHQYQKNMVVQEIARTKNLTLQNFESEDEANLWLAA